MAGQAATSVEMEKPRVVKLSNGITQLKFKADKVDAIAVLAYRDNFNAHGFDIFSLLMKETSLDAHAQGWSAVTFFDGEKERLVLTVGGGADCMLHDFRLISGKAAGSVRLVLADREAGASFADTERVIFSFFHLRKNEDGDIGRPLYYFERDKTVPAKRKYCDVGDAFKSELGLGAYKGEQ